MLLLQVPNFGFVVFADAESVEKTLAAKPILLYGSHRLNVEEKKLRRDGGQDRGFSDRERHDMGKRGSQVSSNTSLSFIQHLLVS